ncbi:MAG TPA: ABC transporter permease subunit, partial [Candidatus Binatia bacterium]|nr:ABC transporter permease subunit [Candidatus Binatia bacterium]
MTGAVAALGRISNGFIVARLGWLGRASVLTAALVLAPTAAVVFNVFLPSEATWAHLLSTVLPEYIGNTLLLVCLVAVGVILFGVSPAWLVTAYRFPGQRILEWSLVLPLAMPAYVMAYAYTDWLQAAGPVQTLLRDLTGWKVREYWFPEIRSLPGAAAMLSFALYPYVYLLARTAFLEQSRTTMEAARLAGYGAWGRFWRVALPLARTGIAAGAALALMEALADFGTVSYFAVNTFTAGIYRAWLSLGDPVAAGQLATCLLVFVLLMLSFERAQRGSARYAAKRTPMPPQPLHGAAAAAAWLTCAVPVTFGFLVPAAILIKLAAGDPLARFSERLYGLVMNTFTLAGVAALAAVIIALLLAYAARTVKHPLVHGA